MSAIITIRPDLGSAATIRSAEQKGMKVTAFPMSQIGAVEWDAPNADDYNGLLIGSANAIRFGGEQLKLFQWKPVFAVGAATADSAREAGYQVKMAGQGGLQALINKLPADTKLRLLRIAGRNHVAINVPKGVEVDIRIAYEAIDKPMPDELAAILRGDAVVLLHSAGSATHFRSECERLGIDLGGISLAALGPRIAEAAGTGWADIRFAPQPHETALLALAADMCH